MSLRSAGDGGAADGYFRGDGNGSEAELFMEGVEIDFDAGGEIVAAEGDGLVLISAARGGGGVDIVAIFEGDGGGELAHTALGAVIDGDHGVGRAGGDGDFSCGGTAGQEE